MDLLTYAVPIVVVTLAAITVGSLAHRHPEWPWRTAGLVLAAVLVGCEVSWWVKLLTTRPFHAAADLPLQLCDVTVWVAAAALVFRREVLQHLTWFWGMGGGIPALFLPVRGAPFPGWFYFEFYLAHGGIIVAALLVVIALGARIRFGTMVRALVITGAVAVAGGILDVAVGGDYLYLASLPPVTGPLQSLSSWPLYRVALCMAAALVMVALGWVARERGGTELAAAAAPSQPG